MAAGVQDHVIQPGGGGAEEDANFKCLPLRRGHSEEDVRKVLGESFLRFFSRVEEVSRSLAAEPPSLAAIPPTP